MIWTSEQDARLRSLVEDAPADATWAEIAGWASEFADNPTEDAVRNRARRIGAKKAIGAQAPAYIELPKAFSGRASWQDMLDIVKAEALALPALTTPVIKMPRGQGSPQVMNVMISDPHVGKLVEKDVVGSTWGYGKETFIDRAKALEDRVLRIGQLQSLHAPIEKLVLWFLGDLIDGTDMRRGHPHRIDVQSASNQVMIGRRVFSQMILNLSRAFEEVSVNFQYGNHGRIGEFGVNLPMDNWDYLMSLFIEADLRDVKNIHLNVPTTRYGVYDVAGQRIFAAHGDQMRGSGGPRTAKAYVENLKVLHRQIFDFALIGHYHTSETYTIGGTKAFANGAWDGGDDFEVNQLVKANDPAQWAFGLSPTRGLTWSYEISLADRRAPTPAIEV